MAIIHNGYKDIEVKLLSFDDKLLDKCSNFGRFGDHELKIPSASQYRSKIVNDIINGKTFPKYAVSGTRIDFEIKGISRICLAQLTRDSAIFCSESHGVRPLNMEYNVPLNIITDESIMSKFTNAMNLLEECYIEACEKGIPYPESRYLGLHCQTISLCCSFTPTDFTRACYSRTNNSFCDELNYVYRKMFYCLKQEIKNIKDDDCKRLWQWIVNERKCINDSFYTRTEVFKGDFIPSIASTKDNEDGAVNDWRKSCWKIELERIIKEEPELLTEIEQEEIKNYYFRKNLYTSYTGNLEQSPENAIKNTDYYKEHRNNAK